MEEPLNKHYRKKRKFNPAVAKARASEFNELTEQLTEAYLNHRYYIYLDVKHCLTGWSYAHYTGSANNCVIMTTHAWRHAVVLRYFKMIWVWDDDELR
jgi:hypothetical protein